jgi:hypothetical protein
MTKTLLIVAGIFLTLVVNAGEIYVNNINGSDNSAGTAAKPFRTIRKAISMVKPGDVIHLVNTGTPYKESIVLNNVNATPDKRITFEGHGSTLSGCEPLVPSEWEQVGPGLYKNSNFYRDNKFHRDHMRIYYFLFDRKMNRMGRSRKGPNTPFKQPNDLLENEWTFTDHDSTFYLRINPAKKLADCKIELPVRSNAVAISGTTSNITIRDLICTNVYNDGFGLTGTGINNEFYNIQSLYCGDDGISAHWEVRFKVFGFISIGNATGICDSGHSETFYDGVIIKDCAGTDLMYLHERDDTAIHVIKNAVIFGNAARQVWLETIKPGSRMEIYMENVLVIDEKNKDSLITISGATELFAKNCSLYGLRMQSKARPVNFENTIIGGTYSSRENGKGADINKMPMKKELEKLYPGITRR